MRNYGSSASERKKSQITNGNIANWQSFENTTRAEEGNCIKSLIELFE